MSNNKFEISGVCHLALVCEDMERTVDFYTNVLGMKLSKTIALPKGGQHFFFDMGGGQFLAFFWFDGAPKKSPGIASPVALPGAGDIATAHGSMNHVSFKIPADKFEEYKTKLEAEGVETAPILNHDDSKWGFSPEIHDGTYMRSMYFFDPDGILLEFAAWTRELGEDEVVHLPVGADGVPSGVGDTSR